MGVMTGAGAAGGVVMTELVPPTIWPVPVAPTGGACVVQLAWIAQSTASAVVLCEVALVCVVAGLSVGGWIAAGFCAVACCTLAQPSNQAVRRMAVSRRSRIVRNRGRCGYTPRQLARGSE